jgi:hypothetical protein
MTEINIYSVPMALFDFLPVILFAVSAVLMQRDCYNKMPKYAFACLAAGCVNGFLAGFFKALWKLLYALELCDFEVLNKMFLPVQSLGLLLTGLGLILMLTNRREVRLLAVPPVFAGTFVFITMMVTGLGMMCAALSVVAVKMKKAWLIAVFILTFFCYMAMGYLASAADTALMNWIEQSVNLLGQLLLLLGVWTLHKAGLRQFRLLPVHQ